MTVECFIGPMFSGKCLVEGTKIIKANGDVCAVENVKQGDVLIDDQGKPTIVDETAMGIDCVVHVEVDSFEKNQNKLSDLDFFCNKDHVMTLWDTSQQEICDIHMSQLLEQNNDHFRMIQRPMEFDEYKVQPMSPFVMGYLYGSSKLKENGDLICRVPDIVTNEFEMFLKNETIQFDYEQQKDSTQIYIFKKNKDIEMVLKHTNQINQESVIQSQKDRMLFVKGLVHRRRVFFQHETKTKVSGQDKIQLQTKQDFDCIVFLLQTLALRYVYRKIGNQYLVTLAQKLEHVINENDYVSLSTQFYKFKLKELSEKKKYFGFRLKGSGRFALSTGILTHNSDSINSKLSRLTMFGNKKCVLISPLKDDRFQDIENVKKIKNLCGREVKVNDSNVKQFMFKNYTHNGKSFDCVKVERLSDLESEFINNHDIVGIDEIHFFDCDDLDTFIRRWYFTKNIVLTLLNYYTNAKIPKQVQLLLPWCSEKTELYSYCSKCSGKATMTDIYNMTTEEQLKNPVGGSDKYRAICRDCYIVKYKK